MYKLISYNLCPYVQRSTIMLNEKEVPYEIVYIDLSQKPDWFLELSPTGRVPLIQTSAGDSIFESAVINEYLDEVHPPHILPPEPLARAQARMWRDYMATLYGPVYGLSYGQKEDIVPQSNVLKSILTRFEDELTTQSHLGHAGPYFRGQHFGMVDVVAAPAFMRLRWVEQLAPELALLNGLPRVQAWQTALLARPSIQQSVLPDIFEIFVASIRKRGSWLGSAS